MRVASSPTIVPRLASRRLAVLLSMLLMVLPFAGQSSDGSATAPANTASSPAKKPAPTAKKPVHNATQKPSPTANKPTTAKPASTTAKKSTKPASKAGKTAQKARQSQSQGGAARAHGTHQAGLCSLSRVAPHGQYIILLFGNSRPGKNEVADASRKKTDQAEYDNGLDHEY